MDKATFIVLGEPYGKKNMRPKRMGKFISSFSPAENKNYMTSVKMAYADKYGMERFGDDEPLKVTIIAYKSIPKSVSKKKLALMLELKVRPLVKPDTDNISKVICDGLNNLAFRDDSQIVSLNVEKYYATTPRVEVTIESWKPNE